MSNSLALPHYSALYAFGDSLSDAGNVSLLTSLTGAEPVSPPYAQETYGSTTASVFSNGPTWVQTLSTALGLGTLAPSLASGNNFAYGGAETGSEPQNSGEPTEAALSLPAQFQQFQTGVRTPAAGALYTLSVGGNDLFDILSNSSLTPAQQSTDVADAVDNEIAFVKDLIGDGAANLLIMNVPDLGKVPNYNAGGQTAEAITLSRAYNTDLVGQLAPLAVGGVRINMLDAYQLIDNAVADPQAYGLGNVTDPVWSGNFTSAGSGTLVSTDPKVQNTYLFFDHEHPTETGHQALATLAEQQLGTTGLVALPGSQAFAAAPGSFVVAQGGPDTITAAAGLVSVQGGSGALLFVGGAAASAVDAQGGSATVFGGSGGGSFTGGSLGHNILLSEGAAGANTTLTGGAAGDRIFGSAAGNDVLLAGVGGDQVLGGGGSTTMVGGTGRAAELFAGAGPTTVEGGAAGSDTIVGATGSLTVAAHGDAVFGGAGPLSVAGGAGGADSILGGAGALSVTGQGSNMLVVASKTSSTIATGNGASLLFATAGSSDITGGSGSLQAVLGAGQATITEGSGASLYDVTAGSAGGNDVINGFRPSTDRIDLFGYSPSQVQVSSSGGSSLVSLTDGTRIQITGVTDPGASIVTV